MDRLHARYPFLDAARATVDEADVDLAALVRGDGPAVDRGVERVESAIETGDVGEPRRIRAELLSYPVARVVVSLVDDPRLTDAYARAEARTAHERFVGDIEEPVPDSLPGGIDLQRLLAEFDLVAAVDGDVDVDVDGNRAAVDVGPYLRLSSDLEGDAWRLVARDLDGGRVPVERDELYVLLREAVRDRVLAGLPLSVPDPIADALAPEVERVARSLSDYELPRAVETELAPGAFPPCIEALIERVESGEQLPDHSVFSLVAFLAGAGVDPETTVAVTGLDPEAVQYRHRRLAGESGADYPSPSCSVMQAYGDCVEMDDRCERIDHPLNYYVTAVEEE